MYEARLKSGQAFEQAPSFIFYGYYYVAENADRHLNGHCKKRYVVNNCDRLY